MVVAYQRRQQAIFSTVHSEGAILPTDLLQRISDPQNAQLDGLSPEAYHLSTVKLNEAMNQAWTRLRGAWLRFTSERARLSPHESGTTLTRERWLLLLFQELGYGRLQTKSAIVIDERSYAISHGWEHAPIHLVSYKVELDRSVQGEHSTRRSSPHSLLQELLNHSHEHLWGIVSNGRQLRILRDNVSLTRQAYVEFDLEAMFDNEVYADFVLLWLLCHQSRVEAAKPEECWLEKWSREAHKTGTRALEALRKNVERAISELGSGFLSHRDNHQLHEKLRTGTLSAMGYYQQLLRMVYRLLVLFVAEDRGILFDPKALESACNLYNQYYSTARLRYQADRQLGTRHSDLYYGLKLVMEKLGQDGGCRELGLPALNGFLFSPEAVNDLNDCQLANYALLATVRHLAYIESGRTRRIVDYKNLGSEELGSVYESLLELHPTFEIETGIFKLETSGGNLRKTTGSYYTHGSLITCLLDSTLDPVLEEAANKANKEDAEQAILKLRICDSSCGSGTFLVGAAHRIAKRLAAVKTGEEEPSAEARRSALRKVVDNCIYGVDINPMAVELCKVSLWMEAIDPGKPLSFLDAHIRCGNSLLGATPALLEKGIPDAAFEPIEGDEKKVCIEFKKLNKKVREGNVSLFREDWDSPMREDLERLADSHDEMNEMPTDTVEEVRRKDTFHKQLHASKEYQNNLLRANAWCAAFVWKKTTEMRPPITDEEFRSIDKNPSTLAEWRKDEIDRLAQQYQFYHWHLEFPEIFRVRKDERPENERAGWSGGFDVVLGNTPWEKIKIQEKEWFAVRRPDIANAANAAQRKRMIEALARENAPLYAAFHDDLRKASGESHLIRHGERYPLCGRGDVNTYAIFAENIRSLVRSTGKAGCIVPSGIATDDTTKFFFQDLMETRSLVSLYSFENREKLFVDVDSRYNFCLLTLTGSSRPATKGAEFVFFARQVEDVQEVERRFSLSASDIRLLNPNTKTSPIFRSKRDAELNLEIYKHAPILMNEQTKANPWEAYYIRLVDLGDHAAFLRFQWENKREGWDVPLYEAKLMNAFDHRYGTFADISQPDCIAGQARKLSHEEKRDPNLPITPRYFLPQNFAQDLFAKYPDYEQQWFLIWRDITNATNERTSLATVIPKTLASRTSPALGFKRDIYAPVLVANLNSFIFDFVTRLKVGGIHLTFSVIKQLPVLPPERYVESTRWDHLIKLGKWLLPYVTELTYTAWDLEPFAQDCGYDGPPFRWDEARRFLLRCELDAAYFHLYGIARDDVDYIMETFPIVKREDEKAHGEYRTKRVILEVYDEMQQAIEGGVAYRTRLEPGPADPAVAYPARERMEMRGE